MGPDGDVVTVGVGTVIKDIWHGIRRVFNTTVNNNTIAKCVLLWIWVQSKNDHNKVTHMDIHTTLT